MRAAWLPQTSSPAPGSIGSGGKRGPAGPAAAPLRTSRGVKRRNQGEKKDMGLQVQGKGLRELLLLQSKQ
eukprot:5603679-Pyramimonas_sp.AAC.1